MFYLDWYLGLGLGLSVSGCDNGGKLHDQQNEYMVQQSNESERSGDEEDAG